MMRIKQGIVWLVVPVLICMRGVMPGHANFKMADAGTTTAQFLKLGVGARAIGMGEAYSSVANDPTAIYWNPAGLASISEHSVSMMHAVWFESMYYDYVAYARPVKHYGVVGLGVQYLSAGKIDEIDNLGTSVGTFKPNDMAVSLSWAEDYNDLLVGVNLKYIMMEIIDSASVLATDVGFMYPFLINDGKIGFSVQNIGGKVKFDEEQERIPLNCRLGLNFHVMPGWLIAADLNTPIDYNPYACFGTEYELNTWNDFMLTLRAGYNSHMLKSELGGISGVSSGIGFSLWDVTVDYAWVPFGDLGHTHRMSLGYKF
ncbi:MAG: PorV/PorQ family protein [bacterium]